jgi:hypothetical protein
MQAFHIGFGLYAANMVVGLLARFARIRFGALHHLFYAIVFAGAIGAALFAFHPALLLTLAALAVLPFVTAKSRLHPGLATLGFGGYLLVWILG